MRPHHEASRATKADRRALRFLIVGDLAPGDAAATPGTPDLVFTVIDEVTAEMLSVVEPDVVLSPLVASGFDCFDLAAKLAEARFEGRYRVAAGHIPNPGLVRRELKASFPGIDFDVIVLGDGSEAHKN